MNILVRVATRRSALALAQAGAVAGALGSRTGRQTMLVPVATVGDTEPGALATIGGTGVFVGAVRDAVLSGAADVGVHSLKDLPTTPHESLVIACVPPREDPSDALCGRDGVTLDELAAGARVGTGSPRRAAQLRAYRSDIEVVGIRGNVDTRLGKVAAGEYDAVVLAHAGLIRLGRDGAVTELIDTTRMLPAPGQGALAIEARGDISTSDPELFEALNDLDDPQTRFSVIGERAVLSTLQSGCSAPVGALATVTSSESSQPEMHLRAVVASVDGSQVIRMSTTGLARDASDLGCQLAHELIAAGAPGLLGEPTA